jgi:hypothetical protein
LAKKVSLQIAIKLGNLKKRKRKPACDVASTSLGGKMYCCQVAIEQQMPKSAVTNLQCSVLASLLLEHERSEQ